MINNRLCLIIVTSIVILVTISCINKNQNINPFYIEEQGKLYTIRLEKIEDVIWELDSLTDHIFSASYYNDKDSTFYFLNDLYLVKCGMNRKSAERTGQKYPLSNFYVQSDTIWGINYDNKELQKYINGELYSSLKITGLENPPLPRTSISPIIVNDSSIFYFGNIAGEGKNENSFNRPTFTKFNRLSESFEFLIGYPEIYHSINWGGGLMRWVYATYNPTKNYYIISFPASHEIEIWEPEINRLTFKYGGSQYIPYINSFDGDKLNLPSTEEVLDYIKRNSFYCNILYDKFRNIYYRIAEISNNPNIKKTNGKTISIIMFDETFNKVGETIIENFDNGYRYGIFVSYKGLMIPTNSNDDQLSFAVYQPKKILYND